MFEMSPSVLLLLVICLSPVRADPGKTYVARDPDTNALQECDYCPPGTYLVSGCTATQATRCSPCPADFFVEVWNTISGCLSCRVCDLNQVMTSECRADSDRQCRCKAGHYRKERSETCLPHTKCPSGEGVLHRGTLVADTECQSCPNGTFSEHTSDTLECLEHRNCELTEGLKRLLPGTIWHDSICVKCDSDRGGEAVEYLERILPAFFNYHTISRSVLGRILYKIVGLTDKESYYLSSSECIDKIKAWMITATAAQLENLPTILQNAGAETEGEILQNLLHQLQQNLESVCE